MDPKRLEELLERVVMAAEGIEQELHKIAQAAELVATDPVYIPTGATLLDTESAAASRLKVQAAMDGQFLRSPNKTRAPSSQ